MTLPDHSPTYALLAQGTPPPVLAVASGPIAPWWIVVPLAGVALLATAAHIIAIREATKGAMPESRRRIRLATGWVIMVAVPLTAYAFGIASPAQPGVFALVWMSVVALLFAIVGLGLLDAFNTVRVHRIETRRLRRDIRKLQAGDADRDDLP